jgi:hypothetical protein
MGLRQARLLYSKIEPLTPSQRLWILHVGVARGSRKHFPVFFRVLGNRDGNLLSFSETHRVFLEFRAAIESVACVLGIARGACNHFSGVLSCLGGPRCLFLELVRLRNAYF